MAAGRGVMARAAFRGTGATSLLTRYILRATLRSLVLVAAALTALFSLLDFVEQLASVGQGTYHVRDALLYVLLTAPSRLLQVAPVAMLLATLLALGAMARNTESTAMLSLGVPERRIVGAVLLLVVPLVLLLLLVAEYVVPAGQQAAQAERAQALSTSVSFQPDNSLWAQDDGQYLNVQGYSRRGVPTGIDIYDFAADGSLRTVTHAASAHIDPDGTWLLHDVTLKHVQDDQFSDEHRPTLLWHSFLAPRQVRFLFLPIDAMPPVALFAYIRGIERRQLKAPQYELAFWGKAAIPLSIVAMVMLAAPFGFGPPRSQSAGRNLALGVGIGIVFSLGQQILGHLGLLLGASPAATALAPPLLVMVLAVWRFRRIYGPG